MGTTSYTPNPHDKSATTNNISEIAENLKDDNKLTLKTTDENKSLSGDVFNKIKSKDIDVNVKISEGIEWSFNGKDIPQDWDGKDINFSIDTLKSKVPADILKSFTAGKQSKILNLNYDGKFGFNMKLTVHIGYFKEKQYANLYYYNAKTKELKFQKSSKINGAKNANFDFEHASDYVILVSDKTVTSLDTTIAVTDNETKTTNN